MVTAPTAARAQTPTATLTGRIFSANGGLPVQNASVELDRGNQVVAKTTTDANGTYSFTGEPQGAYSLLIAAAGFATTRIPEVFLVNANRTDLETAIEPSSTTVSGLKQIASVISTGRQTLQTTTTINAYVDPQQVQSLGYVHAGFLLAKVPGIDMHTSPSSGDDMSISIRGYDPSETSTLLDGHPIGPIGAFGGANSPAFDYKLAPFWGLSGTSVIFGSGATGVYGVPTIAGAVDFTSLSPSREPHAWLTQGIGSDTHSLSGATATGTIGKFGYAVGAAVQGSTGSFPGGYITQTALLNTTTFCNSGAPGAPTCTDSSGNPVNPPGDLTTQNINAKSNTYYVSGAYTQKQTLAKFTWDFSPATHLLAAFFGGTSWDDKTGNGDQDNLPPAYVNANEVPGFLGQNFNYNGVMTTCSSTQIPVLINGGYTCMTGTQYSQAFSGPYGGGDGRYNGSHMQDYHLRLTQQAGPTTLTIDGFANNYNMDEHKGPAGPFFEDNYLTHGYLVTDEFQVKNHDLTFGYYTEHQRHASATNFLDPSGDRPTGSYYLGSDNYFLRDAWEQSPKLTTFLDLDEQHSVDTGKNNFDPRLTLLFHLTPNDVLRLTAGRSYSEPDPALLSSVISPSAPNSVNQLPPPQFTPIGGIGNPSLAPETAVDEEIAYGHRFSRTFTLQVNAYNSLENNAIISSTFPVSQFPQAIAFLNSNFPGTNTTWLSQYLAHLGPTFSVNNLGFTGYANAAQAIYRGFNLDLSVSPVRNVTLDGQYGVQSAFYTGVAPSILAANHTLVNNTQVEKVPLQKAFGSIKWETPSGFKTELDETYIGNNNEYLQPAFWFADASIAKTTGPVTLTLGANNLFNNAATQYGYFGLGTFVPENNYGTDTSALQQGGSAELYGMMPRQYFFTVTIRQ